MRTALLLALVATVAVGCAVKTDSIAGDLDTGFSYGADGGTGPNTRRDDGGVGAGGADGGQEFVDAGSPVQGSEWDGVTDYAGCDEDLGCSVGCEEDLDCAGGQPPPDPDDAGTDAVVDGSEEGPDAAPVAPTRLLDAGAADEVHTLEPGEDAWFTADGLEPPFGVAADVVEGAVVLAAYAADGQQLARSMEAPRIRVVLPEGVSAEGIRVRVRAGGEGARFTLRIFRPEPEPDR